MLFLKMDLEVWSLNTWKLNCKFSDIKEYWIVFVTLEYVLQEAAVLANFPQSTPPPPRATIY